MTPVRACAVITTCTEDGEPFFYTLWEDNPEDQGVLERWIALYRQLYPESDEADTALLWRDFASPAALAEANQQLHDAQWLDEVADAAANPGTEEPIATVAQRLCDQREAYRYQAENSFPTALASHASEAQHNLNDVPETPPGSEAQRLLDDIEQGVTILAFRILELDKKSFPLASYEELLATMRRLRDIIEVSPPGHDA